MKTKRVCLFFDRTYVDAHPCFREMVNEFLRKGWAVDLYTEFYPSQTVPCFASNQLQLYFIDRSIRSIFTFLIRAVFRKKYTVIVATPTWALYWSIWAGKLSKIPVVCFSDEVYSWDQILHLTQKKETPSLRKWSYREKWAHTRSVMTIALSEDRFQTVKRKNNLQDLHPSAVIPNAPAGQAQRLPSSFYHETLAIPEDHTLLLHCGSLDWHFTKLLADCVSNWDSKLTLVLQIRTKETWLGLRESENIRFSHLTLPGEMMRYAVSSADIGLLLYDQSNFVESLNGPTAGKLGLYLSCGLPLIACNLKTFEWIEKEGCGVCISDVSGSSNAASKIMKNYTHYQKNAMRIFNERYEYSKHFNRFYEKLELLIKRGV